MEKYINLLLLFAVYSFLGWVLETVFASINQRKFVNRGFLTGFFCPIYGFGAVLIVRSFEWVDRNFIGSYTALAASIVFSVFLVTALEYITGFLLEKIFHCKWWDYSNNAFNLQGYICFKYSIIWGFMAFLLIQVVHNEILAAVISIPEGIRRDVAAFFLLYFLADTVKSVIDAVKLRIVILNYSSFPINRYYEKVLQYKRFFLAFPRLLILNAGILNRDVRSILNERIDKIKVELKSKFQ